MELRHLVEEALRHRAASVVLAHNPQGCGQTTGPYTLPFTPWLPNPLRPPVTDPLSPPSLAIARVIRWHGKPRRARLRQ
jgi:hypothetical protein